MRIKTIVAGAAIALAATIGSATAADQFATLEGIAAEAMAPRAMGEVTAAGIHAALMLVVNTQGSGPVLDMLVPGAAQFFIDELLPLPPPDAPSAADFEGS